MWRLGVVMLSLLAAGCASHPQAWWPPRQQTRQVEHAAPSAGPHRLPWGIVHARLVGVDDAPVEVASVEQALSIQRSVGSENFFFYAFDTSLLWFVATHREERQGAKRGREDYVVDRVVVLERTPQSVDALHVGQSIARYEEGVSGIHAGMTTQQVEAIRGAPPNVQQLGPVGSFDWIYPDITVRFLQSRVAHVSNRSVRPER